MSLESCRIDVWLWRARFAKTRNLAAAMVEQGAIRLTHNGAQSRLDKPSRSVHPGDEVLFVQGGRLIAVRVVRMGERRGPPEEARALYEPLDAPT
ncbi:MULTISPECIES: RNA-binding S4 domain-containing protein [Brevundimonas]|uniref:RNA-binding S4 domain-containing protein n=1 Tax=Brevundimonas sp. ZS04 TaxID=1906854 RepID=UPI00096E540C|nr:MULTISPECIES: RNA-binding S4 domain-containing protein [Brevundimonas]MBD3819136.1 RNA-binding S4 domain-containing protein [Brevundimonas diminuta]OMG57651.1 RNA-binding protein [Brevundimonas sp. ZS04]